MNNIIEDILYEAHKHGKRELLLEIIPICKKLIKDKYHKTMHIEDLYQFVFDELMK
jgi:hypothetical protein|tara:strand:- start:93 stop:260 length:168 start_codon:yes stop_codon:yes gene_type:complete